MTNCDQTKLCYSLITVERSKLILGQIKATYMSVWAVWQKDVFLKSLLSNN